MAIKTSMSEINKIIKEEFHRLMEKKKIQNRLRVINEELSAMEEEDLALEGEDTLKEYEFDGMQKTKSATGLEPGEQPKAKFEKKGTHLLEDDELEIDDEVEDEDEEDLNLSDEFAELGAAIEAKIMAALAGANESTEDTEDTEEEGNEDEGNEDEEEFEEFEEIEIDTDSDEDEEEPIEEYNELVGGVDSNPNDEIDATRGVTASDLDKKETKSESLNESTSKGNKKYLNILSEGLGSKQATALSAEVERMRRLAKLTRED